MRDKIPRTAFRHPLSAGRLYPYQAASRCASSTLLPHLDQHPPCPSSRARGTLLRPTVTAHCHAQCPLYLCSASASIPSPICSQTPNTPHSVTFHSCSGTPSPLPLPRAPPAAPTVASPPAIAALLVRAPPSCDSCLLLPGLLLLLELRRFSLHTISSFSVVV